MKKKKTKEYVPSKARLWFEDLLTKTRIIPIPVWIILSTIANYFVGDNVAKVNSLYSHVSEYSREEFLFAILKLIGLWVVLRLVNQVVGKIEKARILNYNYMKWITKLTTSKLSTISSVSTGAANSAIHTIAACDKGMVEYALAIIPNIVPFILLCAKEYDVAGITPVLINIGCMTFYVVYNLKISDCQSYKRQVQAKTEMSTVTVDCIKNSQTIKYFNKENWSINRQETTQRGTFSRQLAMPVNMLNVFMHMIMWTPSVAAIWFCWESESTVLYIIMMTYVIDNIGAYLSAIFENYTEKKNQLDIMGGLEADEKHKTPIEDSIVIKNVKFRYDVKNPDAVMFIIDDLVLERGHRYCVTGKSGFGKSTLAKLISGTYAPEQGIVPEVDSVYMFAESEMFDTSIAENITLGDTYDKKEITELMNAFEVVVDLDVFKDAVGERGNKLSTGQCQRINLARTLFYARRHPGALIVMDEVTAALDIKTSLTCLQYLTEEFKRLGVTLVYISNKSDYLETDLITDNIYVHREGKQVTYSTEE